MINLLVDEAYAFDYLAILLIKSELYSSKEKYETYIECFHYLESQIENFNEIIQSQEFKEIYEINKHTFILIDQLREGKYITAKEIDDANMERFNKKVQLHNKFFIDKKLREEKILKS